MRIVSGGQTGVDRAALDVALELGIACEGWCPAGRAAEDGPLPARYPLRETPSADVAERTAWNVRDSDATLVLCFGEPRGGSAFALEEAARLGRPALVLRLGEAPDPTRLGEAPDPTRLGEAPDPGKARAWLAHNGVERLHIAGPRQSEEPGVAEAAASFLRALFEGLSAGAGRVR
jgi:hypothetical protein